jgi:hypothetical protein
MTNHLVKSVFSLIVNVRISRSEKMELDNQYSIGDRKPRRPLIRHISELDLEAMDKLVKQLKHERLIDKICNRIPKTWH